MGSPPERYVGAALLVLLAACVGDDDPGARGDAGGDAGPDAGADVDAGRAWLRDDDGGVVLLRGTNVAGEAKWRDDHLPPYGRADFERLRDELGLNAIRLLVFWQALEPVEGDYDEAYLAEVRRIAVEAGEAGLRVLVDMHQDVYGEGFGFTGAPAWSCDQSLYDSFEPPDEWFYGYFEPEVVECFDRFWGTEALQAAFRAAWARLARELHDVEAVFAYDLLNEPSWGSTPVATFDREVLPDAYAALIDAIRDEDPEPYVALEPASAANIGLRSRFEPPDRPRLAYAPHVYPASVETGEGYDGDQEALETHVGVVAFDASRTGLPLLVGELGVRRDVPGAAEFLADAFDALDGALASAFQWDFGRGGATSYALWDEAGEPAPQAEAIARPTPWRIGGEPERMTWDAGARSFELVWNEGLEDLGPTVVRVPTLLFGGEFVASLADGEAPEIEGSEVRVAFTGGRRALAISAP